MHLDTGLVWQTETDFSTVLCVTLTFSERKITACLARPEGEVLKKVALIGKGLTFDSGGYNIKVCVYPQSLNTGCRGDGRRG